MALQQAIDRGPWPGPRPYREADRRRFFGRDDEQEDFLERLDAERLLLLTAPSAVGKTSFLRASLVPELRRRRRRALERNQPTAHPAVIVVRDWPVPDVTDPDRFLIRAVAEGIEDLKEESESYTEQEARFIHDDYDRLKSVEEGSNANAYIVDLAEATGGLTLIFDQFEEALQGSPQHISKVCEFIVQLYRNRQVSVRLLLSFREEFLIRLTNGIGRQHGDITKVTEYLQPIAEQTLRDALLDAAKVGNVELAEDALEELLRWMEIANSGDDGKGAAGQRANRTRHVWQIAGASDTSINLLKLQALLLQLYEVAARDQPRGDNVAITMQTLNQFQGEADIVERALQRFIDSLLPLPSGLADSFGLMTDGTLDEERERMFRRRRAAARMGPSFSSGGFKVQQEQAALLARAWREDWEVLGIDVNDVNDALTDAGDLAVGRSDLFEGMRMQDTREENELPEDMSEEMSLLSGIAKFSKWSMRTTAIDLIDRSLETLELLREGNVLRRKSLQGHVTYELVHDGFGDALFDWSEETRAQPLDALTATTADRGTAFRWTRLTGSVKDIAWRGCWVGPDPDKTKRLLVEDVIFEDCDLRGTVFERCDFRGGAFRNCNLGDVAFWDCSFEGSLEAPFLFHGVAAGGVSFGDYSTLRHVRFTAESRLHNMSWNRLTVENVLLDRCIVNQMTIGDVMLMGRLSLHDNWVLLSDLVGLKTNESHTEPLLDIQGCDLFYCRLDDTSGDAVSVGRKNRRFPNPEHMGTEPNLRDVPEGTDPWRQPL